MKIFICAPGTGHGLLEIEVLRESTVKEIIEEICVDSCLEPSEVVMMHGGKVLDESSTIAKTGISEHAQLSLVPACILAQENRVPHAR